MVLDSSFEIDDSTFKNIKEMCAGKEIYMVTTMQREELPGVHMISFQEVLEKHPEYFSPDRVHLTQQGNDAFFDCIVNSLNKGY